MSPHPDPKSYLLEEVVPEMSDAEKAQQLPTIKSRLANPYANPGSVVDKTWWREAMPEQNMMTWGGKEIFADDIGSFAVLLDDVRVSTFHFRKSTFTDALIDIGWSTPRTPEEAIWSGKRSP